MQNACSRISRHLVPKDYFKKHSLISSLFDNPAADSALPLDPVDSKSGVDVRAAINTGTGHLHCRCNGCILTAAGLAPRNRVRLHSQSSSYPSFTGHLWQQWDLHGPAKRQGLQSAKSKHFHKRLVAQWTSTCSSVLEGRNSNGEIPRRYGWPRAGTVCYAATLFSQKLSPESLSFQ